MILPLPSPNPPPMETPEEMDNARWAISSGPDDEIGDTHLGEGPANPETVAERQLKRTPKYDYYI